MFATEEKIACYTWREIDGIVEGYNELSSNKCPDENFNESKSFIDRAESTKYKKINSQNQRISNLGGKLSGFERLVYGYIYPGPMRFSCR